MQIEDTESVMQSRSVFARISRLAANLRAATVLLELGIVLVTLAGILIGFVVTLQSAASTSASGHFAAGTAIIVGSALGGLFYWCVARTMHLFAEDVALHHRIDLAHRREAFYNEDERKYVTAATGEPDPGGMQTQEWTCR